MSNKVHGLEALNYLTNVQLGYENVTIIEHNAGIDVDDGARMYDREREVDKETLYWVTLMYVSHTVPDGYTIDDLFTAEYDVELNGATDIKLQWFHINEDMFDSESRGTHFEFVYED